ncbi:hypothetical protein [Salinispora arenicola]|nr:hypothetical protein [Salinispora arenicola]NIL64753.1 hypothetical protein [Salinispora arenicola]
MSSIEEGRSDPVVSAHMGYGFVPPSGEGEGAGSVGEQGAAQPLMI